MSSAVVTRYTAGSIARSIAGGPLMTVLGEVLLTGRVKAKITSAPVLLELFTPFVTLLGDKVHTVHEAGHMAEPSCRRCSTRAAGSTKALAATTAQ